jgi:hypothetical protein
MSLPTAGCCVAVLNQQRQETTYQCSQPDCKQAEEAGDRHKTATKTCTVVENGRVVVKPIAVKPVEASSNSI